MCFGVKILNFGVAKSGISVFLVSGENGAGVNKKTIFRYGKRVICCLAGKYVAYFAVISTALSN